jgi:hypothetical protein
MRGTPSGGGDLPPFAGMVRNPLVALMTDLAAVSLCG